MRFILEPKLRTLPSSGGQENNSNPKWQARQRAICHGENKKYNNNCSQALFKLAIIANIMHHIKLSIFFFGGFQRWVEVNDMIPWLEVAVSKVQ